jgi:hypothetical protein
MKKHLSEDGLFASVESLAAEALRLGHLIDLSKDTEIDQAMDFALTARLLCSGRLCAPALRIIAMITHALAELPEHHHAVDEQHHAHH